MQNKIKNIVVTVAFSLFLLVFSGMCVVRYFNPQEMSWSERRFLAQFPKEITWEGIVDKTVINKFEEYSVDQFPGREFFRGLKARFQMNVLQIRENNGLAVQDGYIAAVEQEFNPVLVEYSLGRLGYVYDKYLKDNGGKKYLSIVPDKNYFLGKEYGYPMPDYEWLVAQAQQALPDMQYIDVFDALELADYYRTDTHWSQDKIGPVVDKLAEAMGVRTELTTEYEQKQLEPFYGVYYGQSGLSPKPDTLTYLTSKELEACTVYDYETGATYGVYDFEKFKGKDGYEFFLSGTKALLRVDNPAATSGKELIVFRDSFGSSITPLFTEAYESIYVVDIRYVTPDFLEQFIDFKDKDVLYLYSALILNTKSFK